MTISQVESLRLGLNPIDDATCLYVESAILWINNNTSLDINADDDEQLAKLPANVRLFISKYHELMSIRRGVASESISGLSQSFTTVSSSDIWDIAEELLGDALYSRVRFVKSRKQWC